MTCLPCTSVLVGIPKWMVTGRQTDRKEGEGRGEGEEGRGERGEGSKGDRARERGKGRGGMKYLAVELSVVREVALSTEVGGAL